MCYFDKNNIEISQRINLSKYINYWKNNIFFGYFYFSTALKFPKHSEKFRIGSSIIILKSEHAEKATA